MTATLFDMACEVLNVSSNTLKSEINISHREADERLTNAWYKMNPVGDEGTTSFYTINLAFTYFQLRLHHTLTCEYRNPEFFEKLYKFLPGIKTMRILDYGCGCGSNSLTLHNYGCKDVTISDVPSPLFKMVRKLMPFFNYLAFGEKFPLTEMYDLIICTDVLEHVKDPDKVLSHLSDHTKYLYMTTFFGGAHAPYHLAENNEISKRWKEIISGCGLLPVFIEPHTQSNGLFQVITDV